MTILLKAKENVDAIQLSLHLFKLLNVDVGQQQEFSPMFQAGGGATAAAISPHAL